MLITLKGGPTLFPAQLHKDVAFVIDLGLAGVPRALFLLLHQDIEFLSVNAYAPVQGYLLGKLEREPERIVEVEDGLSVNCVLTASLEVVDNPSQQVYPLLEGLAETFLFRLYDPTD